MQHESGREHIMAVETRKVVVCDLCGKDHPTQRYTITAPSGTRRSFDLCEPCVDSATLRELAEMIGEGTKGPKQHQQPVLTLDAALRRARKGTRKA